MATATRSCQNFSNNDPNLSGKMNFFVRMVRSGSITAAAEETNLSISTGSRWINDLEQQLGVKLCLRRGGSFNLTAAGHYLFEKFSPISDQTHSLIADMSNFIIEPQGKVRICCTPIFAQSAILPIINAFNRIYRKVRFSIDINPYGLKQYQRYDLIINAETSYKPQENNDLPLVKRNLVMAPFVLVASPDYLSCYPPIENPQQLQEHICLYADSLTRSRQWAFSKSVEKSQVQLINIPDNLEVSDTNLLFDAAKMGMGIAYLPKYIVEDSIDSGRLVILLPQYHTANWMLNLYYPELANMEQGCAFFKDFFLGTFRDHIKPR